MRNNPVRRAQLIAPFGVGAMQVMRDGTSLITCGLDHWFEYEDEDIPREVDVSEFEIEEWRLQKALHVNNFRLPPEYRRRRPGQNVPNSELTVPFLRFPRWHFCSVCRRLLERPATARGKLKCEECREKKRFVNLAQVPFVAMCERGHLQDFPWREWVHGTSNPTCQQPLQLVSTGGASLEAQKVKCECGAVRNLGGITTAYPDGSSELSSKLDRNGPDHLCAGLKPWLGPGAQEPCGMPLRGSLRGASNVYFADVRSAIYLPRGNHQTPSELVSLLQEPQYAVKIAVLASVNGLTPANLRRQKGMLKVLEEFTDAQISAALQILIDADGISTRSVTYKPVDIDDEATAFRRAEYEVLRIPRDDEQLSIRASDLDLYDAMVSGSFSRLMLIDKLRETRALAGFTRVFPETAVSPSDRQALLRAEALPEEECWLPAYIVYGEGIFLELDESRVRAWEQRQDVIERVQPLIKRYEHLQENRRLRERPLVPRFILLHTLAHLIMNRLTFECGYSSASLRERLYVSAAPMAPMAAILIYTAAGDAEGTMGGLVRMGKSGYLEQVIAQALLDALWCSADPVCMEMGSRGGQGPDSCNLAACHNCALVPETACEEFNRFLDRGVVVGEPGHRAIGYFDIDSTWQEMARKVLQDRASKAHV